MLVIYRKDSGAIDHFVTAYADDYLEWLGAQEHLAYVTFDESATPNEIGLDLSGDEPRAFRRAPFPFDVPPTGVVGIAVRITGIPKDTEITGETGSLTMGRSGLLDLTFDAAGSYPISFQHPQYVPMVRTIEVAAE